MAALRVLVAPRLAAASVLAPLPSRLRLLPPSRQALFPRAALHCSAPRPGARVAVVLSGCGVYDGTEIHEASAILVHLSRGGADVQIFAPDTPQMHVVDHTKGQPSEGDTRNVLIESARIARGKIVDLAQLRAADHDAAIFPGGFGAAKNLSTFAVDGKDCKVNRDVERVLKEFHSAGKPIGLGKGAASPTPPLALLLSEETRVGLLSWLSQSMTRRDNSRSPALLLDTAPARGGTPSPEPAAARGPTGAGAHRSGCEEAHPHLSPLPPRGPPERVFSITSTHEVHVDQKNKVVTTPAFMCETALHHIHDGIGAMVRKVLELARK
ncbi:glutamine amidotransferase-like class 1 domain-containing protein 3, mitochondrial [Trichechus manatus latirostris]|uniref:Glutamine amidotransferase-like class 1 domain-containing protein 3, mitochondrial n=1 Tax=Trichechus manatus latirostris TaxID=127582 RepID=A0A2Y9RK97_TRIMA|nr:glutamine amidotransferase-like class 1 domain-containing protein 3, mitochondrial [Trichechus manatus latirostris]